MHHSAEGSDLGQRARNTSTVSRPDLSIAGFVGAVGVVAAGCRGCAESAQETVRLGRLSFDDSCCQMIEGWNQ